MKMTLSPKKSTGAFTLIELLVVIGIIALLTAIIIPAAAVAKRSARISRATAELHQLETVIESYKAQKGFYPPDNGNTNTAATSLFYELTGTYLVDGVYHRINGLEVNTPAEIQSIYAVGGIMNSSPLSSLNNQAEIKEAEARAFWRDLEPGKYGVCKTNNILVPFLGLPIEGMNDLTTTNGRPLNPWCYQSSHPTNNHDSYDLWIDLKISAPNPFSDPHYKIMRICNWSSEPIILN